MHIRLPVAEIEIDLSVHRIYGKRDALVVLHRYSEHHLRAFAVRNVELQLYARRTVTCSQQAVVIYRSAVHRLEIFFELLDGVPRGNVVSRSLLVFRRARVLSPFSIQRNVLRRFIRESYLRARKSGTRIPAGEYESVAVCSRRSLDNVSKNAFYFATAVDNEIHLVKRCPLCV